MGSTYEGEWSCLSKMYTTTEESDFMAQLLGGLNSVQNDQALGTSLSLSVASDHRMPEIRSVGKKWRSSEHVKNKPRNVKPRKTQKAESTSEVDEDATWGPNNSQSSSLTCSENENTASQNGESSSILKVQPALNLNGKTRAGRGSATDPQSLYARKRRERINERLKTLQGLVPNGTKVDISTMLEEAVQYVKFLQLQIKLLSSDDLWIYAPLAYNGMDIADFDLNERTERSM